MGLLKRGQYEFDIGRGGSVLLSDYRTVGLKTLDYWGDFVFFLLAFVHAQLAEVAFGLGVLVFVRLCFLFLSMLF